MKTGLKRLQDALNLAVNDAKEWDNVCDAVVDVFGATGALLPPTNPEVRGLWMAGTKNMKLALVEYLSDQWNLKDPREGVLELMFEKGHATDDDVFPDRAAKAKMPFYRDFLRPHNFGNVCTIRIHTPNGFWPLTVHFANDHPPLTKDDICIIKQIQALFEKATASALNATQKRIAEFAHFFVGTGSEVFVFDADGNQCLNVDQDGKYTQTSKLNDLLPVEVSENLNRKFRELLASDPKRSLSNAYQFSAGEKTVNVLVIQTPPSLRHFFMPFKACAIRTECSQIAVIKHNRLRSEFGLSDGEVLTVDLLSSGKTPAVIAELMSLKATSIRQRLKLIFEKTGVKSQVELIAFYGRL